MAKSVCYQLCLVWQLNPFCEKKDLVMTTHSLVTSRLDDCNMLWGPVLEGSKETSTDSKYNVELADWDQ